MDSVVIAKELVQMFSLDLLNLSWESDFSSGKWGIVLVRKVRNCAPGKDVVGNREVQAETFVQNIITLSRTESEIMVENSKR